MTAVQVQTTDFQEPTVHVEEGEGRGKTVAGQMGQCLLAYRDKWDESQALFAVVLSGYNPPSPQLSDHLRCTSLSLSSLCVAGTFCLLSVQADHRESGSCTNCIGTNCIGTICIAQIVSAQIVSGTNCIGHKLYRLPLIFLPFHFIPNAQDS
jgi:hypothetical protein